MDDGPLVYYKLTLWAFDSEGSGELKIKQFQPNSNIQLAHTIKPAHEIVVLIT